MSLRVRDVDTLFQPLTSTNLRQQAIKGSAILWSVRPVSLVVQVVSIAMLARLLTPEDFGLRELAAASIAIFLALGNFGIPSAIIKEKEISRALASNLFLLNFAISASLALLVAVVARPISLLYNDPEIARLIYWSLPGVIIGACVAQHRALLERAQRYRPLAALALGTAVFAPVAQVILAAQGYGAISLVWGQLIGTTLYAILILTLVPWMPQLRFNRRLGTRSLFNFGFWIAMGSLFSTFQAKATSFIIGAAYSVQSLGHFSKAQSVASIPSTTMGNVLDVVFFPSFSRVTSDLPKLRQVYKQTVNAISILTLPGYAVLAAASGLLVELYLGPQWSPAAQLVPWIILSFAWDTPSLPNRWLYLSLGLSSKVFRRTVIIAFTKLPIILLLIRFELVYLVMALGIYRLVMVQLMLYFQSKDTPVPSKFFYCAVAAPTAFAAVTYVVVFFIIQALPPVSGLLSAFIILISLLVPYAVLYFLPMGKVFRQSTAQIKSLLISKVKKKNV